MVYDGYLRMGGNEIVNSPRAEGITRSFDCYVPWIEGDSCLSLRDALGDSAYSYPNIATAPWYDPSNPELSSRVLGVYGLGFSGVKDSTRQVQVTEGLDDGGVIGSMRKGVRQVRTRIGIIAIGEDAMEYARTWLEAALDPGACGQHAEECGTTDVEYLATCPPARGMIPYYTDWQVQAVNRMLNPGFETSSTPTAAYTNLLTNPSFEAGTGSVTVATNWALNPLALTGGSTAETQTRYGWSHAFVSPTSTPVPGLTTAARTTAPAGGSSSTTGYGYDWGVNIDASPSTATGMYSLPAGSSVSISAYGRSNVSISIGLAVRFYNSTTGAWVAAATIGAPVTLAAGAWGQVTVATTAPTGTTHMAVRGVNNTAARAFAAGDFIDQTFPCIQVNSTRPPFGGTIQSTPDADLTAAFFGAANNSPTVLSGTSVATVQYGVRGVPVKSTRWVKDGTYSVRIPPNVTGGQNLESHAQLGPYSMNQFVAGRTYTLLGTFYQQAPSGTVGALARALSVVTNLGVLATAQATDTAGAQDLRTTFTIPASGVTWAVIRLCNMGTADVWWDLTTLVVGNYAGPAFTGSTSLTVDPWAELTPSWTGTANASTSILSGPAAASWLAGTNGDGTPRCAILQSIGWPAPEDPTHSIAIIPNGTTNETYAEQQATGLTVGQTYTLIGRIHLEDTLTGSLHALARQFWVTGGPVVSYTSTAANAPGDYEVRGTFIASANNHGIRIMNGSASTSEWVRWDMVALIEGLYSGRTFTGDTQPDPTVYPPLERYSWADGSAFGEGPFGSGPFGGGTGMSTYETRVLLEREQTDEEYAAVVDPLRRYLHGVAATGGPTTITRYHRDRGAGGDIIGEVVEFTLTATRPWVYGVTKQVDLPSTTPFVVEDVQFNLVPYPSMQLASAALVNTAVNLSTNPSVEVDAVGWAFNQAAPITSAMLAGARTTELAAVGLASYKVTFTASADGVGGWFSAEQVVALPASPPPRARYSISMWGAAIVTTGTPVVTNIQHVAEWLDASSTVLRTDVIGTVTPTGGASSLAQIAPPAGATQVRVSARCNMTSFASGNVVRLFADALTVSTP